jgi:hypothetical protein
MRNHGVITNSNRGPSRRLGRRPGRAEFRDPGFGRDPSPEKELNSTPGLNTLSSSMRKSDLRGHLNDDAKVHSFDPR